MDCNELDDISELQFLRNHNGIIKIVIAIPWEL